MNENEIWKPVVRFGRLIPGYLVSNLGRVRSPKGKILSARKNFKANLASEPRLSSNSVELLVSCNLFKDIYDFRKNHAGKFNSRLVLMTVRVHRLVMEAFKPLDENLPAQISKEEWNKCPEPIRQMLRECCVIDHIDDDPTNNSVDNLRWVTPVQNNLYRKHNGKKPLKQQSAALSALNLEEFLG